MAVRRGEGSGAACGLTDQVPLIELPDIPGAYEGTIRERSAVLHHDYWMRFTTEVGSVTHLIALERVGPNHTRESIGYEGASAAWELFHGGCPPWREH